MDEEKELLRSIFEARNALLTKGWRSVPRWNLYLPEPGQDLLLMEHGSTGIHHGYRDEVGWWVVDGGDVWPSEPFLWRPLTDGGPQEPPRHAVANGTF